jgi:hypothetical protein
MGWVDYHLWEFADDGINTAVLIVIRRLAQINPAPGSATFPDKYREIPSYDGATFVQRCCACIKSALACALLAAVKIARGSLFRTVSGTYNGNVAKACCVTVGVAQLAIRFPLTPIAIITSSASPTATRLKPTTLEPNVIGRDGLSTRYCCNSPVFTRRLYSTV